MLLVGSLTTSGHEEITPVYDKSTLFELEGFTLPKPVGKGLCSKFFWLKKNITLLIKLCFHSSYVHLENKSEIRLDSRAYNNVFKENSATKPSL